MRRHPARRFARALAFSRAASFYWLSIWLPLARELRHWREQAERIPDESLRAVALRALVAKRGNVEGAAAFATLATPAWRRESAHAMAAYQAIFDYVDCLCELPNADPIANGRRLNQALLDAVRPGADHADYYALHGSGNDGGYLARLVERCRETLTRLPSYASVSAALDRATRRVAAYQSLNHGDAAGSHEAFARWAASETTRHVRERGESLHWWEIGASCGSSLGVFALIAVAARREVEPEEVQAIDRAYFPWIGATNSLLDSLVDRSEDTAPGQHELLGYYASLQQTADRLGLISREAARRAGKLPPLHGHTLLVAAMVAFYLAHPQADDPAVRLIWERIESGVTEFAFPVRLVMRVRRSADRLDR